ncbi:conjugal transfer protein TraQ [Yersinia aldovae]|uniref:conjugal transfer protein TraQ n=1 Tax=Yersinia aldovae TaxID=29483 RepID=UPI0011A345DE|nr:conjugal transfer protein TraQ [Yersinia aldovae]
MEELSSAFVKFVTNITGPAWTLLWTLGLLIALILTARIFSRAAQGITVPGRASVTGGEVISVLIISALLANYSGWISTVSNSVGLGDATYGQISYIDNGGSLGKFAAVINSAMTFASLMGGIYGFKGLLLLHKSASGGGGQGQDLIWKAITHIIFGGLLVRIAQFMSIASNTVS